MARTERFSYRLAIAISIARHSLRLRYARAHAPQLDLPRRACSLDGLRVLIEQHPAVFSGSAHVPQSYLPPDEEQHGQRGTNPL